MIQQGFIVSSEIGEQGIDLAGLSVSLSFIFWWETNSLDEG
ncbi:hypothetical protein AB3329_06670 [Streptococcus sp. H31]